MTLSLRAATISTACSAFFAILLANAAMAVAAEKRDYSYSNPTPDAQLRELSTDRPDKTESAYTVDAGRFQIESDVIAFTRDTDHFAGGDTHVTTLALGAINLKAGLRHDLDLQVIVESYLRVKTNDRVAGTTTRQSGWGDTTIRVKKNLWGNDGGSTAFALMPFLKLPTHHDGLGNDAYEGGLIIPLAVALPKGWGLGLMSEIDWLANDDDRGRHFAFIHSATFAHDIVGNLGGYIEIFTERAESAPRWLTTLDWGLTYGIGKNIQLDAGVNIGLSRAADDVNAFVGFSRRF